MTAPTSFADKQRSPEFADGLAEDDEPHFYEWAEKSERRDELILAFRNAQSMVSVQIINSGLFSDAGAEPFAPLWDWLLHNRRGVLVTDSGAFYDKDDIDLMNVPLPPSDTIKGRIVDQGWENPLPVAEGDVFPEDSIPLNIASPHASGTIKVRLVYGGRSKPSPFPDPDDEIK